MSDADKQHQEGRPQRPASAPVGPRPTPAAAAAASAELPPQTTQQRQQPQQAAIDKGCATALTPAAAEAFSDPLPAAAQQWALWQMMDSAFPTGSFAHSNGLESSVQAGLVSPGDASAVRRYATAAVHSTCSLLLPYAAAAHAASLRLRPLFTAGVTTGAWGAAAAAADGESEIDLAEQAAQKDILRLCAQLDAQLAGNHVARRASSATGAALLRAAAAAFPAAVEVSAAFEAVQGSPSPHFAVAFGCVYGALGVPWPTAARAYAFTAVRDIVSAATRLNVIGPMAAATLLHSLAHDSEAAVAAALAADLPPAEATSTNPIMELLQGGHDQLYARLFQS